MSVCSEPVSRKHACGRDSTRAQQRLPSQGRSPVALIRQDFLIARLGLSPAARVDQLSSASKKDKLIRLPLNHRQKTHGMQVSLTSSEPQAEAHLRLLRFSLAERAALSSASATVLALAVAVAVLARVEDRMLAPCQQLAVMQDPASMGSFSWLYM